MRDTKQRIDQAKQTVRREALSFFYIFAYFYICLVIIVVHRSLILKTVGVTYLPYGFAVVKALILAKFTLLGHDLRLGERFNHLPLIFPTLYAAAVFFLLLVVLSVAEEAAVGLWHGETLNSVMSHIGGGSLPGIIAESLIMFVVLVHYFAFRHIAAYLGEGKMSALFFRRRDGAVTRAAE